MSSRQAHFGTNLRMSDLTVRDLGKLQGSTFCSLNIGDSFLFARLKKKNFIV